MRNFPGRTQTIVIATVLRKVAVGEGLLRLDGRRQFLRWFTGALRRRTPVQRPLLRAGVRSRPVLAVGILAHLVAEAGNRGGEEDAHQHRRHDAQVVAAGPDRFLLHQRCLFEPRQRLQFVQRQVQAAGKPGW